MAYARGENERTGAHLDTIDPLNIVTGLRYDSSNGNWGGELLWTVVADKDKVSSDTATEADGYALLDLVGDLQLGSVVSLRAGIFNIFDEEYAIWQSIQGLNKNTAADTILNNYQPGTNIRVGLNIEF